MEREIYMVQKIDGYGGWGETYYGDVIAAFETREDAENYCYDRHLTSAMGGGWPTITITKQKVHYKDDDWGGYY